MLYAGVINARVAAPSRSACIRVFDKSAWPMPGAWVSGLTKSCDKNQNVSVIQLKPKPRMVSPCSATQSPSGSSARQNFGNAIGGGAGHGRLPWRTRNSLPASWTTRSASSKSSNFAGR